MKISKKVQGYLTLAKRVAAQSEHDHFKHGAVLVRGGSVINTAHNKDQYKRFGNRFRNTRRCGHATHHAELGCVLGLDKSTTQGTTLYVVRTNRAGEFRLSKPCAMCEEILRFCGIKKVIYTTGNGVVKHKL
jgi:tRNA(Arg) A34 adenosine deaminase TadA